MAATNIPRGIRNNNPANIKYAPQNKWQGQAKPNQGFCTFITPIYGLRAAYRLIGSYYTRHNLRTVAQIISRWSPDGKTIEDNYAWYVARGPQFCILKSKSGNKDISLIEPSDS